MPTTIATTPPQTSIVCGSKFHRYISTMMAMSEISMTTKDEMTAIRCWLIIGMLL
jgi:hypothetical protein